MIKKQSSKNTTTSKSLKKPIKKNSLSVEQDNLNAETEKMTLLVNKQNDFFLSGQTRSIEWRKKQLELLYNAISSHEQEIFDALKQDLSKSPFESYMSEIGLVLTEIKHMRNHISQWSKPKHHLIPLFCFPGKGTIYPDPYGVTLIMSPWNYPFMLTLNPLVGSIAAGNCTVIKPSRYSPATSLIIEKILKETFPQEYIAVVQGGHIQNTALLKQHFDFIFFTGSVSVGKTVMESAAQFLTPVCLELGGKSPCIIDKTADIEVAARRVVWGKFLNAGQTCVAPDYILVDNSILSKFSAAVDTEIKLQYGNDPIHNDNYCKIINEKHFERLSSLVPQAQKDASLNKIAPTVVQLGKLNVKEAIASPLMQDELFGPIMPIISYDSIDDVISFINSRNKPLALYLFTKDTALKKKIISSIRYGGGCINDVIFHVAIPNLPFGGVGESGMGNYHGKASFSTFTHYKSILSKPFIFDIKIKYAPYNNKLAFVKKLMK